MLYYYMSNKKVGYRQRLQSELITKTQIALEAIRRYDKEQERKHPLTQVLNPRLMISQLDRQLSNLSTPKAITLETVYKIQLFAHSQQFYYLQMINYIFPMRILLKNVKNEGTLFIGYDKEYPGIQKYEDILAFQTFAGQYRKNYDFKTTINRDMLLTLKNKNNKTVHKIYFNFTGGSSLVVFDFKVQFIGFSNETRIKTEPLNLQNSQQLLSKFNLPSVAQFQRSKSQAITNQKKYLQTQLMGNESPVNKNQNILIQDFHVFTRTNFSKNGKSKANITEESNLIKPIKSNSLNFLKKNQSNISEISQQRKIHKTEKTEKNEKSEKSEIDIKIQENRRNKQMIQSYKIKDKELRQTAFRCKRLIEAYQKTYNQQNIKKRKQNRNLTLTINLVNFVKHCSDIVRIRQKKLKGAFKINYLCNRFIKRLKAKYQESVDLVNYRNKRVLTGFSSLTVLLGKVLHKTSILKSSQIIYNTFDILSPSLTINHALKKGTQFRTKIKLIQRTWKIKYHSRIRCLLFFIDSHIQSMIKQFSHLKSFRQSFYSQKINYALILEYLKDESLKFRHIYDAYIRKIQQIDEFIQINSQMIKQNKSLKKQKLAIPKRPNKPLHRFFRNLDILKSMVRTWFELEFKKWVKKSNSFN